MELHYHLLERKWDSNWMLVGALVVGSGLGKRCEPQNGVTEGELEEYFEEVLLILRLNSVEVLSVLILLYIKLFCR